MILASGVLRAPSPRFTKCRQHCTLVMSCGAALPGSRTDRSHVPMALDTVARRDVHRPPISAVATCLEPYSQSAADGPVVKRTLDLLAPLCLVVLSGCTPPWSLRMDSFGALPSNAPHVVDSRPEESKRFRFVDFAKVSNQTYLGDSNTTPKRVEALTSRAAVSGLAATNTIEVSRFDILNDTSGSACQGCALATASYSGAIVAEGDRKPGDNVISCELAAKLDGKSFQARASAKYRTGALDGPASESFAKAADACVSQVIDKWLSGVRG